jgi:hypothetical protein
MSAQHTPGPWSTLSDDERARIYQDASLRINDIEWYRFHGIDPRPTAAVGTSYWQSSLTQADVQHLRSLGLAGSVIKGNPYRSHLKAPGAPKALCGAEPGSGTRTRKMVDRTGWLVYDTFEAPGRTPCEACLKAAESTAIAKAGGASK